MNGRKNERVKLIANTLNNVALVVLGGAVLKPFLDGTSATLENSLWWALWAVILHLSAHMALDHFNEGERT